MNAGWGELAAFGTALGWAFSSYVHGQVGRMVGATGVTLLRLPFQLCVLGLLCLASGPAYSLDAHFLLALLLSGVSGVALADFMLYKGITIIGPQLGLLLISLSSPFTALIGWLFLDEAMSFRLLAGITLCLFGIAAVVGDRAGGSLYPGQEKPSGRLLAFGAALGVLAALFQAVSFIAWKWAMADGASPLWATFVRLVMAAVVLWGTGLFKGWTVRALSDLRTRPGVFKLLLGACLFSSGGMWCAGLAMNMAPAGVAATIIGLQPVLVTVLASLINRSSPSAKSICGTVIAFAGTAIICLR
ncbi:DMT family transporter [Desulfovibrio sp. OttesenSCG-928-G11]|nr:DMT family transporter [Desulfovibrio sp. OttesenSCG-928-G11]